MSRMMKLGTETLSVILWFASILIWFGIFVPIEDIFNYFSGDTTSYILHSDDFMMPIRTHEASANMIASFPAGIYTILMVVGYILMLVGVFMVIQGVSAIVRNIQEQVYFSTENSQQMNRIVKGQIWILGSSLLMACANQLMVSWLYRISRFGLGWDNLVSAFVELIIFALIAMVYTRAVNMKTESDLTI
ncbi:MULTISPECIES: DUF2975 domain-containing protein [Lactiplantibacillus]|uniref:DUF2975 domain-containing protein n=1 Tax=Lactiplantibacillus pentosus TaxID=1589 RepID=A0AAW8WFN1_LACPE|nr:MULTISPECIES: DUF2975 domain-containing protein [Lactiplantibacillus]MBU7461766.1 DUF2975 domain-containing protein [Lactiplantibacillus pentosus]MBU7477082.1 DUF2975 domain-containing protein [Lactiplantibacillus pentosus]MBU7484319.1 DUF2975 domain-containing protein [Lactiplantibacillus sp. 30.2.29]MBU7487657.1 DUF2975 domain-containing protein [Lactiplantibacillus pentosus]MBU7500741.1 DUF2975 domain-containing protein [Lactiplantibacillus pentosus]